MYICVSHLRCLVLPSLAMRLTIDLGTEIPEQALDFLNYFVPTADQFVPLKAIKHLEMYMINFGKLTSHWKYFTLLHKLFITGFLDAYNCV